jgi:ABC-type transport system involved in multi-copper enzyme maturation permease subunit
MMKLAFFKFKLLMKQKLGWAAISAAFILIPFSLFLAVSSFVRPDKIYWDLTTSFSFIISILLASYLGSHLFYEEQQRKTLSFILTLKNSRAEWIYGKIFGISLFLLFSILCWTFIMVLGSYFYAKDFGPSIVWQAQLLMFVEALMVLAASLFFSFYLRPLLAWFLSLALMTILHSKSYLELLVKEARYDESTKWLYKGLIFILNFLPPLEWWDIRMFVGFREAIDLKQMLTVISLGLAWIFVIIFLSKNKMEKMDL